MKLETTIEGLGPATLMCMTHDREDPECPACNYILKVLAMPPEEWAEALGKLVVPRKEGEKNSSTINTPSTNEVITPGDGYGGEGL